MYSRQQIRSKLTQLKKFKFVSYLWQVDGKYHFCTFQVSSSATDLFDSSPLTVRYLVEDTPTGLVAVDQVTKKPIFKLE